MSPFRVVDLGTKQAGALQEFLAKGDIYFGKDVLTIKPAECLGIDHQARYAHEVKALGYEFWTQDILANLDSLPEADYYLAWDFLEHLPNVRESSRVLRAALARARIGVWLRMPSFEQDEEGEGQLRKLGLRFAWSHWHGHPSHYLVGDAEEVFSKNPDVHQWRAKRGKKIFSTNHPDVVPISAPLDTVRYDESLGPRRIVRLNPVVIGQWEVLAWKRRQ